MTAFDQHPINTVATEIEYTTRKMKTTTTIPIAFDCDEPRKVRPLRKLICHDAHTGIAEQASGKY